MWKKLYNKVLACVAVFITLVSVVNNYYAKSLMEGAGIEDESYVELEHQFDMIVDQPDSTFWQAVYKSGKEYAMENGILLQLKGTDKENFYDKIDLMNMSIAARADGIILEYNGEANLADKINEAAEAGIPVVTVMGDAPLSRRQSFIGVSDYQLGKEYAESVTKFVGEDTRDILLLTRRSKEDTGQSVIVTQIGNAVTGKDNGSQAVTVEVQNLPSAGAFDAEEAVHEIFQKESGPPDIIVCMDEEITECTRQAVIDLNLVGNVTIIGYYISESILDAVSKGIISLTCNVDTTQLGQYSVQTLAEYLREGRVSIYNSVDVNFVDQEKAIALERRKSLEKYSLEESVTGK